MRKATRHKAILRLTHPVCGRSTVGWLIILCGALVDCSAGWGLLSAQEAVVAPQPPAAEAILIDVGLPITDAIEKAVAHRAERALRHVLGGGRLTDGPRPIFVFVFRAGDLKLADKSSFGDALDLARFISGSKLQGVETVAWAPQTVSGHAVLPLLACERIAMAKGAEIGAAGRNESPPFDEAMRAAYLEYAARKRTVPPAIAQALLDQELAVFKVTSIEGGGVRYELEADLKRLREQGLVSKEETFLQPGEAHLLSSVQMRECAAATLLADSRRSLAAALQIPLANVKQDLVPEDGWKALRLDLTGPIHKQSVNWILAALEDHRRRNDFNLLVLAINSGGGDLTESHRLAQHLAGLEGIHTVAFVNQDARSDAALVALACDDLIIHPQGRLGGPGEGRNLRPEDLAIVRPSLEEMYRQQGRDWSLPLAMVDSELEVHRYTNPLVDEVRYLSVSEAATNPNIDEWQDIGRIETHQGLSGDQAESLGLARNTASGIDELTALYALPETLLPARPNWVLAVVEWLADPRIASLLLFVGGFALLLELSTPGATVPGFTAVLCFLLFFWSKFLHGTADWLEIMLFVGGVVCLAIELFALPGFGIFGFGGGMMLIASIVLASQTFVLPTNAYQLRQFPVSLAMLAAGMAGGIVSVIVIRRYLPETPYFNRVVLKPPKAEEREALRQRESLVSWDHLRNKRGISVTPLVPAGKVQFGDDVIDCISNGELIGKGTPVIAEEVTGNRVVVRRVNH